MKSNLSIPRDALAELLRIAGSPLTPEQYLAALPSPEASTYRKYASRAVAAAFSKYFILIVAVLAVILLPVLGFSIENIIIAIWLSTVTFFEYRVHRYFRENNPSAPSLGFRNQTYFALAIIVYCLYHGVLTFPISHDTMIMVEQNNLIDQNSLKNLVRMFYLVIAVVAGGSQFGLAWYYRTAEIGAKS